MTKRKLIVLIILPIWLVLALAMIVAGEQLADYVWSIIWPAASQEIGKSPGFLLIFGSLFFGIFVSLLVSLFSTNPKKVDNQNL